MCLNLFKRPDPGVMQGLPPVAKSQDTDTALPDAKKVVETEKVADVSYGTGAKKSSPGAGKKTGTQALAIKLNQGAPIGTKTGGLNV